MNQLDSQNIQPSDIKIESTLMNVRRKKLKNRWSAEPTEVLRIHNNNEERLSLERKKRKLCNLLNVPYALPEDYYIDKDTELQLKDLEQKLRDSITKGILEEISLEADKYIQHIGDNADGKYNK